MVRAMSTKERPSVAVKELVRARNTARIMKTAPLPKTKKIEKLPIPGKGKKKIAGQPRTTKALAKKGSVKSYNLRKTVTNSRELKQLTSQTNKSPKKSTSISRKSSVKKTQSKNKVISSPRVAPVKPLNNKKSLLKSVKKANNSKPKVKVAQLPKNGNKVSASKSKPKVIKPAATIANPTDSGKVIKVINPKKPTSDIKKSVTFVLQKKERKPSRYFELLANKPPQSRERVAPVSQLIKQNAKKDKDNLSPRKQAAENDEQHNETRQEDVHVQPRLTAVKSMKSIAELEKIKQSQTSRLHLITFQRKQQEWTFDVFTSKRPHTNVFKVTVSTILKCSCFDYRSNKKICSHITFVVDQVAKDHLLIDQFEATKMILSSSFQRFDQAALNNLKPRMNNGAQNPELKIETSSNEVEEKDCPICFCEMEIIEKIDNCTACRKFFHHQCLSAFKTIAKACPLCKSQFNTGKTGDSLEKIEEVLA